MSDYPSYPSEQKTFHWKPVAIVAAGVVLAIALVVLVVWWVRTPKSLEVDEMTQRKQLIEQQCADAIDPTACATSALAQYALTSKNVDACTEFEGDNYDGCVGLIAYEKLDQDLCEEMNNKDRARLCATQVIYQKAIQSGNSGLCAKIADEGMRAGCVSALEVVTAENCSSLGKEQAYCQLLQVIEEASARQDRRLCEGLSDEQKATCREFVLIDDPDRDGLTTEEELNTYLTNPDHADTDADGYLDGAEVQSGYNPNGPGTLETP